MVSDGGGSDCSDGEGGGSGGATTGAGDRSSAVSVAAVAARVVGWFSGEEPDSAGGGSGSGRDGEFRCDACDLVFPDLTAFMTHRNYECLTGQ